MFLVKRDLVHFADFGIRCAANGIYPEIGTADMQICSLVENCSAEPVQAGCFTNFMMLPENWYFLRELPFRWRQENGRIPCAGPA